MRTSIQKTLPLAHIHHPKQPYPWISENQNKQVWWGPAHLCGVDNVLGLYVEHLDVHHPRHPSSQKYRFLNSRILGSLPLCTCMRFTMCLASMWSTWMCCVRERWALHACMVAATLTQQSWAPSGLPAAEHACWVPSVAVVAEHSNAV